MQLPSQFQIGEDVFFKRYDRDDQKAGQITAVRFTKAKVFYDILDDVSGDVKSNIDSVFVAKELSQTVEN